MIEIYNRETGQLYRYDPMSHRIFRDGFFVPPQTATPVYSGTNDGQPSFAGIYLPEINSILTLTGNVKEVTPIDKIH